jgi:hypothetical protein
MIDREPTKDPAPAPESYAQAVRAWQAYTAKLNPDMAAAIEMSAERPTPTEH